MPDVPFGRFNAPMPAGRQIDPGFLAAIMAAPGVAKSKTRTEAYNSLQNLPGDLFGISDYFRNRNQQARNAQMQQDALAREAMPIEQISPPFSNFLKSKGVDTSGMTFKEAKEILPVLGNQTKPPPVPKPVKSAAGPGANEIKTGKSSFDAALDASKRLAIMQDAVANPNAQNDMALLFNHIGMTLSAQKGARITEAEINRAVKARSLPGNLNALYTQVANGQFLTPQQRQQMLELGIKNRDVIWESARNRAQFYGVNTQPKDLEGLPKQNAPFQMQGKKSPEQRYRELETSGTPEDAIYKILKAEGY